MAENILLAVDLSYQTYRASAAHKRLTNLDGDFTGGLYGFLVTVAKIINETGATHVAVCQDFKPYRRSELYPEYKALRKKSRDEELYERFQASKPLVVEACQQIGLPLFGVPGFESDDCIGALLLHRRRFKRIYAASNDSDLYQLFWWPDFYVYASDLEGCMNGQRLMETQKVTPDQFVLMTALTGTHNDVAGIPKVGPITARKAVFDPGLMRAYHEQHGALIERNRQLIKLPYDGFPPGIAFPMPTRSFKPRDFFRFLARFDITATQSMVEAFSKVCP